MLIHKIYRIHIKI